MVAEKSSLAAVDPSVVAAIDRWRSSVFGAPRRLTTLITAVTPRDEVIHRVLTDVVRRELREERMAAIERQPSPPRVPLAQVDPFAGTLETLRADTLHVAVCGLCQSSGRGRCPACSGRGVVSCPGCGGAGKFRNPKTNRLNKCKACKGTGSVDCGGCVGSGTVSCQVCRGSGHQRVWLTYTESRKPRVVVHPDTPVAVAHRQLREPRILTSKEIEAFTLETEVHAEGRLNMDGLPLEARGIVQRELAAIAPRLERVVWQQYIRLAVVRRDVNYEMCGTTGTVALSGNRLTGASTREALRPVRRRLILWPILFLLVGVSGMIVAGTAMGRAPYFAPTNNVAVMLWLGATICSVPAIGGLLRAWRPGLRFRGLGPLEAGLGVAWALMLAAIVLVGLLARPTIGDVEEALAADEVGRARFVLDGLLEREGETPPVLEVEDVVLMAEANLAQGEERLAKLDAVSSHHGGQASAADTAAHAERLAEIRELVNGGRVDDAIAAIEHSFAATWRDDPEVAEERARAEELRVERCSDDVCRLVALRAARDAHESPSRAGSLAETRGRLLSALAQRPDRDSLSPADRVRASDEVFLVARKVLDHELADDELSGAANVASAWAVDERSAIPILGAELETLRAFFPPLRTPSKDTAAVSLEGAELFFSIANGKCRGIYAVGPTGHRELDTPNWTAERILSQALGRPVLLLPPKDPSGVSSSWKEGKTKIVARWRDGVPVELRIGDATP